MVIHAIYDINFGVLVSTVSRLSRTTKDKNSCIKQGIIVDFLTVFDTFLVSERKKRLQPPLML